MAQLCLFLQWSSRPRGFCTAALQPVKMCADLQCLRCDVRSIRLFEKYKNAVKYIEMQVEEWTPRL